ncbi:CBS domain-containing protein [Haloplanus halobius]|uniref:CBS domain-containing protein n=1 Tax=Haloplanus halobius TaxID=2934938 RepID=UPI00200C6757|nr:CBS domain-containing protein [Haloplanus sp. XH21]
MEPAVEAALTGYGRTVAPETPASEAAQTLREPDVPLLVVEDEGVEGVVTESDFVAMVAETAEPVPVSAIMSDSPVTVSPLTPVSTVVEKMHRHGVKQVLVVDNGASKTPTGEAGDSETHSSSSRPEADTDGTYWGFVSIDSVEPHLTDSCIEVEWNGPQTTVEATDSPIRAAGD